MKFVHGWTAVKAATQQQQQQQPKRFFYSAAMSGMAMDLSGHRLLVTTMDTETNQVLVVSLPLSRNDDDDDTTTSSLSSSSMNMPQSQPGAIATDSHGNMFLATVQNQGNDCQVGNSTCDSWRTCHRFEVGQ
ncbi:hypothetical protein IV203_028367 [Nitzschia inconspicua]|uniref:Uncharacterized protein n=1 Tax=Nitzschia inconspicua TaxID=303405 RepID=A0A9K3PZC6_9STRA|nr:hypothetical protein IV203_028367 [Nitzschia inconspicua]